MVCDGRGVIPCISLLRMTVVTCLGCCNHVSLNWVSDLNFGYWQLISGMACKESLTRCTIVLDESERIIKCIPEKKLLGVNCYKNRFAVKSSMATEYKIIDFKETFTYIWRALLFIVLTFILCYVNECTPPPSTSRT